MSGRGGFRGGRGDWRGNQKRGRDNWRHNSGPKNLALGDPKGFPGVLVMCDERKEQRAMHEVADLLNEHLDERYPLPRNDVADSGVHAAGVDANDEDDDASAVKKQRSVADELADELAELGGDVASGGGSAEAGKSNADGSAKTAFVDLGQKFAGKRARWMDLDGRGIGMVWINGKEADVIDLIDPIFETTLKEKKLPTRFVSRMLPLQRIVKADTQIIVDTCAELALQCLPANKHTTYKLEVRARNNTSFRKGDVISAVVSALTDVRFKKAAVGAAAAGQATEPSSAALESAGAPAAETASAASSSSASDVAAAAGTTRSSGFTGPVMRAVLEDPETIVLIEVIKTLAGISIITDGKWVKYERYNIRTAAETPEEREARIAAAHAQAEKAAAAEAAKQGRAATAAASSASSASGGGTTQMWFAKEKEEVADGGDDDGGDENADEEADGGAGADPSAEGSSAAVQSSQPSSAIAVALETPQVQHTTASDGGQL